MRRNGQYLDVGHAKDHENIVNEVNRWTPEPIEVNWTFTLTLTNPAATTISQNGITFPGPFARLFDSDLATEAFNTATSNAGAFIKITHVAGQSACYERVGIYMSAAGSTAQWRVEWSDNDETYFPGSASFVPSAAGWSYIDFETRFPHRYWRLYLENTPGAGPFASELAFYVIPDVAVPHLLEVVPTLFIQTNKANTDGTGSVFPGFTAWTTTNIYIRATSQGKYHLMMRK